MNEPTTIDELKAFCIAVEKRKAWLASNLGKGKSNGEELLSSAVKEIDEVLEKYGIERTLIRDFAEYVSDLHSAKNHYSMSPLDFSLVLTGRTRPTMEQRIDAINPHLK